MYLECFMTVQSVMLYAKGDMTHVVDGVSQLNEEHVVSMRVTQHLHCDKIMSLLRLRSAFLPHFSYYI